MYLFLSSVFVVVFWNCIFCLFNKFAMRFICATNSVKSHSTPCQRNITVNVIWSELQIIYTAHTHRLIAPSSAGRGYPINHTLRIGIPLTTRSPYRSRRWRGRSTSQSHPNKTGQKLNNKQLKSTFLRLQPQKELKYKTEAELRLQSGWRQIFESVQTELSRKRGNLAEVVVFEFSEIVDILDAM